MVSRIILTFLLLLSVPLSALATSVVLPQTGQTLCYDPEPNMALNVGEVTCTGTGQDGATQVGAPWSAATRFTVANGAVTDTLTGLVWLQDMKCAALSPPGGSDWPTALAAANGLASGACGLTDGSAAGDWRLPNVGELESLVDLSQAGPAFPVGYPFTNFDLHNLIYWSSTITPVFPTNSEGVDLYTSTVRGDLKTSLKNVWAVRGTSSIPKTGQAACWDFINNVITTVTCPAGADGDKQSGVAWPAPRFTDNLNGTLTDNLTGLIWLQQADCFFNTPTQEDALAAANTLATGTCGLRDRSARGDWRLPNRIEMRSLLNYNQTEGGGWLLGLTTPPLTPHFTNPIVNTIDGWYWTSDSYPSLVDAAHPAARNIKWMVKSEGGTWTNDDVDGVSTQNGARLALAVRGGGMVTITGSLNQVYDGTAKSLSATRSPAGRPVNITYDGNSTAPTNVGSYLVKADITDLNFQGTAGATLNITPAHGTVSISGGQSQIYDGSPKGVTTTTVPPGLAVTVTYPDNATAPIDAGKYAVTAKITDTNYQGSSASDTLVISQAAATVALSNLSQTYDGTAKSATVTTLPAGLAVTVTYPDKATPPINAGKYAVVAAINDTNYAGSTKGTLEVSKATPSITWTTPAPIGSGTALSATQLNAVGSVPGILVYSPALDAIPAAGAQTLSVTLTPTDATDYASASASVTLTVIPAYTVTFASGGNGSLTGTTTQTVVSGASATAVTALPAAGYHFVQWTGDGGFTSTTNPLALATVTATQTVTANFAVDTFLVTASAFGGNGTISCASPVNSGSNCVCTVTPAAGYHLVTLTDNGADRLSAVSANSFTITNVASNQVVSAAFARPTGIVNQADGKTAPDLTDALAVLKIAMGLSAATASDLARADIAPLGSDGMPMGDGQLDIYDVIAILRMMIGQL